MPTPVNADLIARLEAMLADLRANEPAPAPRTTPTLLDLDPRFTDQTLPTEVRSRLLGEVIAPYLSADGRYFARDFWMKGLVGAMAGASVSDYNEVNIRRGMLGGEQPRETFIVGPDVEGLNANEVVTSPGTIGWNPLGASYAYNPQLSMGENARNWYAAGAPKVNGYGVWGGMGLPQAYIEETWKHPSVRNLNQPGWPGSVRRRR